MKLAPVLMTTWLKVDRFGLIAGIENITMSWKPYKMCDKAYMPFIQTYTPHELCVGKN